MSVSPELLSIFAEARKEWEDVTEIGLPKMTQIIESFGLSFEELSEILKARDGIVAGSAALAALTGSFEPGDIDIFVPWSPDFRSSDSPLRAWTKFLSSSGFEIRSDPRRYAFDINVGIHGISRSSGKTVDVLGREYLGPFAIQKSFDLSCTCVFYDGNRMYAFKKHLIDQRIAETNRRLNGTEVDRLKKYADRGFTIQIHPSHMWYSDVRDWFP